MVAEEGGDGDWRLQDQNWEKDLRREETCVECRVCTWHSPRILTYLISHLSTLGCRYCCHCYAYVASKPREIK